MDPRMNPPQEPGAPDASVDHEAAPRSRRAILAATVGGLAGSVAAALGRPVETHAAAGDALRIGQANYGGSAGTRLSATSSGGAFWVTQNGFGSGVRGDSADGHGGVFTTQNVNRYGVLAQGTAGSGLGAAVRAEGGVNIGVDADGAWGVNARGSSVAVRAISPGSWGVYAEGPAIGLSAWSGAGIGVKGESNSSYGGYFIGPVHVTGTLTKGGGAFRIDHPLDPANRLLQHSFVESPDMKNVYDGVVATDARGEATVELPEWFEALNRDVRYQLTAVGAAMPELHVKTRLAKGRFVIGGAAPGEDVSWQVTGIRRDAWAEAHRIEVELDKTGDQKGKYLHPVEHGQPASKGVDWEDRQRARTLSARVTPA